MDQKKSNIKLLKKVQFIKALSYPFIYFFIITGIANRNRKLIDRIISSVGISKSINNFLQRFDYEKMYDHAFSDQNKANKLAVFPMLMGINGNFTLLNLLLSSKLEKDGFKPLFFYCHGDLPICNRERIGKTRKTDPFLCHECYTGYPRLSYKTGIATTDFNSYFSSDIKQLLKQESLKIETLNTLQQLREYNYQNIPVGVIAKKSVLRYFFVGELHDDAKIIAVYKSFLKTCVKTYLVFDELVKRNKNIGLMVIQNGSLATESMIIEVCTKHKVNYTTYERWIGNNSILFKKNGRVMDLSWDDEWEIYKSKPLNEAQKSQVENYMLGLQSGKEMYARLNEQHQNEKINHLSGYVCLFTNLNFDTAVLEKHTAFKSMIDWIIDVIDFWQNNNITTGLVIRIHPGEVKLRTPSKEFAAEILKPHIKTANIVLLDSTDTVNSYILIDKMKFALVYTSTIGLEIAYKGKPVLVAGDSFYRNKPFVISPPTKELYFNTLQKILDDIEDFLPDKNIAEKYIHFLYFHKTKRLNGMKIYTPNSESNSDYNNWKKLLDANTEFVDDFSKTIES